MRRRSACLVFAVTAAAAVPAGAQKAETTRKPPLTKEQEREKFHPRTRGMDPAPRLAGSYGWMIFGAQRSRPAGK